jgi:hypothetical protein
MAVIRYPFLVLAVLYIEYIVFLLFVRYVFSVFVGTLNIGYLTYKL